MEKSKNYYGVFYSPLVIKKAHDLFLSKIDKEKIANPNEMSISKNDEKWNLDNREEFLAECAKADSYNFDHICAGNRMLIYQYERMAHVTVCLSARNEIESIFNIFEENLKENKIVVSKDPVEIFIGHGRDSQWKDLKDHLYEKHGFSVNSYEIGPRAGLSVKEVLEKMLDKSGFALLVLTAEDQHADGELHARENVIHELGLFQGKLGFLKAVALLEDGVKEFSNILGINQIRFAKGNIRATFGDILATIKREFK